MVKDDVKIELTTHRGLLYVNPTYRLPPERTTPPKHIGFVYHIIPHKPKTVYIGPIQRTDKDHWKLENGNLIRVHRKWRKALFEPREQQEMPITFERVLGQRTTMIENEDGFVETIDDNWLTSANPTPPRGLHSKTTHDNDCNKSRDTRTTIDPIWIGTKTRLLGKSRWYMETTPCHTTNTTLPTRSRTTSK